ncbi:MAG: hypothetical protein KIH63_002225 [Candidatus Saccharibacteria bacterium]|nr:hypothetical protein [Candidatus Saccharibacteria bacterium]
MIFTGPEFTFWDLQGIGASRGVIRYAAHDPELGFAFVYGSSEQELAQAVQERQARAAFAAEFPDDRSHIDGFAMFQREVVVPVLRQPHMPNRIVDVTFVPPYEDSQEQDARLDAVREAMIRANERDADTIAQSIARFSQGN